jgi:hypothetical protein
MDQPPACDTISEVESVANETLRRTATLFNDLKHILAQDRLECPTKEQLEQWKTTVVQINKAVKRLGRLAFIVDDRHTIEKNILLEGVKRDALDREASFAHTWTKLRQQTCNLGDNGTNPSIDRAQAAAVQVERAIAALAPVPDTHYHGAPALALLK